MPPMASQLVIEWHGSITSHSVQEITLISPNGPETPFGDAPRIRNYPVVALFEIGMSDYDENVIYMPLASAQEMFLLDDAATGVELRIARPG